MHLIWTGSPGGLGGGGCSAWWRCIILPDILCTRIFWSVHLQNVPSQNFPVQNVPRHKFPATKRPKYKTFQTQNVPSLKTSQPQNLPNTKCPSYKTSQALKHPKCPRLWDQDASGFHLFISYYFQYVSIMETGDWLVKNSHNKNRRIFQKFFGTFWGLGRFIAGTFCIWDVFGLGRFEAWDVL
jgi:hypothetical protein